MIPPVLRRGGPRSPGRSVFVFPGQGSQFVGMGRDLYDESPAARAVFDQADEHLGIDLARMCFEGPEEDLELTYNAQPSILTVSVACLAALRERAGAMGRRLSPSFVAGHSMGEYTALVAADVLDFADALHLVRERGRLMEESGFASPGGQAAVIGLDASTLDGILRKARELGEIGLACINSPLQTVISGELGALSRAMDLAKEAGARRVARLKISIASHSPLMQQAATQLSERLSHIHLREPHIPVVANITGQMLNTAAEIKRELADQLCKPVQWTRSVLEMTSQGGHTFVELGPGQVLSGLIKRIDRNVQALTYNEVDVRAISTPVS
ncbi:MAG TPA: ACP S-malonyltransferase [Chloroflexota bacterium]|nr:ACP S-malonyltransferase [Chloroflexota bacterium]